MIDFEKHLNETQLEVVKTVDGPVLVVAGAGSGKTRIIEYRVLYFIQKGIAPESILLLTFTRKSSHEMLSRAAKHDNRCANVEGGTFHSFAYRILKKYSKQIGFGQFTILDESDVKSAIDNCLKKTGFFRQGKDVPNKNILRKIFSAVVNKNIFTEDVLEMEYPHFLKYSGEIEQLRREYIKYKIAKDYMDYDDLLIYLRKLLSENEDVRKKLTDKYRYIMVDEYQDTNKLQADITYFLGKDHKNVMVVGDDAQSIYGFRGASHQNIMDFPKKFSGCKILKLETNYRSNQLILDVANVVMDDMKNKYSKRLRSAHNVMGDKPQILFFRDENAEADWIVNKINELGDEGVDLENQAVLFRSSHISIPLQLRLSRMNIPYQVFGGLKFYETAHVKDMFAHLKVLLNPKDEISWHRVLTLLEGVGPKTADTILKEIETGDVKAKKKKYAPYLEKLLDVLKESGSVENNVERQFRVVFEYYSSIARNKFDDWKQRAGDLEELQQLSVKYESLSDFIVDFALEAPEKASLAPGGNKSIITLSTVHSAKGLEWDNVFIMGLVDGILPISFSLGDDERIEEEKRLFYVALTRAKKKLFLSANYEGTIRGKTQFNKVSRFVEHSGVISRLEQKVVIDNDFNW
jgi:DNA helicase II / ATP-dependent DNA helicase PcrA